MDLVERIEQELGCELSGDQVAALEVAVDALAESLLL